MILTALWTLAATVGLGVNYFNLQDARQDLYFVEHYAHKETRYVIAKGAIRREYNRAVIQAAAFTGGLVAFMAPVPPHLHSARGAIAICFTVCCITTTANSVFDRRDRKRITEMIEAQASEGGRRYGD